MTSIIPGVCRIDGIHLAYVKDHLWGESRHFDALAYMNGECVGKVWNNGCGDHHQFTPSESVPMAMVLVSKLKKRFAGHEIPGYDTFDVAIEYLLDLDRWSRHVVSTARCHKNSVVCFREVFLTTTKLPKTKLMSIPAIYKDMAEEVCRKDKASLWDSPVVEGHEVCCLDRPFAMLFPEATIASA